MAREVTERKEGQEPLTQLLELAPDAMVVVDGGGVIVSVNAHTEELFGYERSELLGQPVEVLVPERARAAHHRQRSRYAADPHARAMGAALELSGRRKDGSEFPVEVSLAPVPTPEGMLIVSAIRDIGERRRFEASRARLAAVVDASGDAIISKSVDGTIESWNAGAEWLYGYSAAEAIGQPIAMLAPAGHDDEIPALTARVLSGERVERPQTVRQRKDGSFVDVSLTISPIRDSSGRVIGASTIARDVTERQRMEDELRVSHEQALEALRVKSQFLANMSHELRTPLNGVVGMAELMLETSLDEEQSEYARIELVSAEALLSVINDILDFAKIEAGRLRLLSEDYSLEAVAGEACAVVAHKADETGLELTVSLDPQLSTALRGDSNRVRQVLINLIGNAVKFTASGEIKVTAHAQTQGESPWLRISVADTGIGIAADTLSSLFEPFTQADASNTRAYGGTGLGLAISKQLVELMGGEIGAQSTLGQGSTFWFTLPYEPGAAVEAERRVADLTGVRVLIVDEPDTHRRILARQTARWGMSSDTADGGAQALTLLHRAANAGQPYAVAIIDKQMADMDGLTLVAAIKASPQLRGVRLIMVRSSASGAAEIRAAGVDAQLTKPVTQGTLQQQLANVLGRAPQPPEPRREPPARAAAVPSGLPLLIVDDNEVSAFTAEKMLATLGYTVELAQGGQDAIEMTDHQHYAAVFMDCQMPVIDGYAATAAIRDREANTRHTTIIAMTAHAIEGDREKCLAAGMDDYIAKPLRMDDLALLCDRALGPNKTGTPTPATPR